MIVQAHEDVGRPHGHTPLHSLALMAMIHGLGRGVVLEIEPLHDLFMTLKATSVVEEHISFAARNALERMFVKLGNNFESALLDCSIESIMDERWPLA